MRKAKYAVNAKKNENAKPFVQVGVRLRSGDAKLHGPLALTPGNTTMSKKVN